MSRSSKASILLGLAWTLGSSSLAFSIVLASMADSASAASVVVQELRKARLARIKSQAFGSSSHSEIAPAAGPILPTVDEAPPTTAPANEPPPAVAQSPSITLPENADPLTVEQQDKALEIDKSAGQVQVGGASPGTTFRQAPIEEPILDDEQWQELLYAIELNGRAQSDGEIVLRSPDQKTLAVEVEIAQSWRLRIDPDRIIQLGGIPFYPITDIDGGRVAVDESRLTLTVSLPASAFETISQDVGEEPVLPPPQSATGGFLDYDFIALTGETVEERIDGLVELGAFSPLGVGLTSVQLNDVSGDIDIVRLESTVTKDFPDKRASLRIGDSITTGGSLASAVRFGGLQWSTNFATDPNFVTFPLPTIGGLSEQQSVIEVVSDNLSSVTTEVPAGPFQLGNIPVVTGAGELQVTVTDLLGREQTVTQPYYVSSQLLKPGLHDFAYEFGFARESFGEDGFDYGDPLLSTTHRFGITDGLTFEGHADADIDGGGLIAGGAAMLGGLGVVSGGVGASTDVDFGEGYLAQLAYDYRRREFNAGVRSRFTSEDYRTIGGEGVTVEREDQFNVGFEVSDFGRLGLLLLNREFHDAEASRSVTGSFSMPLLGGSLLLNAAHTVEPESETAFIAAFSMPLSRIRSISTFAERRDDEMLGRVQYRRNRDRTDLGLDYRIGAEYGENSKSLDGRLGYNFPLTATSLEFEQDDDGGDVRAGVAGSVALIDGKLGLSRPLGRAFGMVDLPGYPDVTVFLDNREAGRTDDRGRLLLPSLRPYQGNKVSLEVDDLPLEARIIAGETVAVPFDGAGVNVALSIGSGRSAVALLIDRSGSPLPAGMTLNSEDGLTTAQVAREGLSQLDGLRTEGVEVSGDLDGRQFSCFIRAVPLDSEPFPDLGSITCE